MFQPFTDISTLETLVVRYPSDEESSYLELAEFVKQFLPTSAPYIILGESFSGPIAVAVAQSKPPGLVGLILCASFISSPLKLLRTLAPLARFAPTSIPRTLLAIMLMGRFRSNDLVENTIDAIRSVKPSVLRQRIRSVMTVDYRDNAREVDVPALYLRATEDRIISEKSATEFLNYCPKAEIVEVAAPHFLLQCCPKEASACIEKFACGLSDDF